MTETLDVTYEWTNNVFKALTWLQELPDTAAFDFEAASKYTDEDRTAMQLELDNPETSRRRRIELEACLKSTALSHPFYTKLTHMSFACSETHGKVIVFDSLHILKVVMNWLITTKTTQIWHNASYDFRHIHFLTGGRFPPNYEDSALLAKCIMNHVDVSKAKVGLKDLMGHYYGDWAVAADYFSLDNLYNEDLIKYAAIDACATYKLWNQIQSYTQKEA